MKETELVLYSLEAATIEALKTKYMDIVIRPGDRTAYSMVMGGLRECRDIRLDVDVWHKERKRDIVKAGKFYDAERRRVYALVESIESPLKEKRQAEDARIEKIEADRVQTIRDKIEAIRSNILKAHWLDLASLSMALDNLSTIQIDDFYAEFQEEARSVLDEVKAFVKQAYDERLKFEQEEAERKVEAARLAKIAEEQAKEAARLKTIADEQEAVRKAQEKAVREIQAEKDKIEAAKKAGEARIAREAFEKQALENARVKAAKEAQYKAEQEEKARIAKEEAEKAEKARQKALRPDKEKLITYVNALFALEFPDLKDPKSKAILANIRDRLSKIVSGVNDAVGRL